MRRDRLSDGLIVSLAAMMVAVRDYAASSAQNDDASKPLILQMQMLADEAREFTRAHRIKKTLRVSTDPSVAG